MAQDDYQLLEEYTVWREDKLLHEVDTSVEAFKAEREAEANARRIEKALGVLDNVPSAECEEADMETVDMLHSTLEQVRDALAGDREFIEYLTLTGKTAQREYI